MAERKEDSSGKGTKNADTKAGEKNRHIGSKGSPIASVGGVPGYNKGTGTPGWIRKAASHAESMSDKCGGSSHQGGGPPYGGKGKSEK